MRIQAALPVAAVLLVAFSAPSQSRAAVPKACDLLTPQLAASVLGAALDPPSDDGDSCMYTGKSENVDIGLTMQPGSAEAIPALRKTAAKGDSTESVPGLGDSNLLVTKGTDLYSLTVLYHQHILSLAVGKRPSPALKAAVIEAMKQMLAKI